MTRILLFILLLPLYAAAQPGEFMFSSDSLNKYSSLELSQKKYWKFHEGDAPAMATQEYNDSTWPYVNTIFTMDPDDTGRYNPFSSIGWFRMHFIADSGITNIPLALSIEQMGACEIYLDGKRIGKFGAIKGKDSSIYVNPQSHPLSFIIPNSGTHLLAIRYANYDAKKNYRFFRQAFSGIIISVSKADNAFYSVIGNYDSTGFFAVLLFAIFITLSVLHLFLYLYYKAIKSNLYFSLFCFSLSIACLLTYFVALDRTPIVSNVMAYGIVTTISILIASLSGFSNELFSRKKLRFRIICVIALLNIFFTFFFESMSGWIYMLLSIFVLLEAIVLTISGIIRRIEGARIIGTGMLFFAFFLVFIFILAIARRNLEFSGDSGAIYMYIAFLAIISLPASMSIYLSRNVATLNRNLARQLRQVEDLSAHALEHEQEKKRLLEGQNEMLEREVAARTVQVMAQKEEIERQHNELKKEKKKSDDLLLNILPAEVAEELKEKGSTKAKLFERVTVLFTDFVGFTSAGERMTPEELIDELDACFKIFDQIMSRNGIEKIKTIGDAYLAICGLPEPVENHAEKAAAAALEIAAFMAERRARLGDKTFEIRIGIHSGSVVAGIVGIKKFAYDIWGDTVNTAARMEQHSEPGKVNVSEMTHELIKEKFTCTYRGKIEAKNKGELNMYFIEGRK